MRKYTNAELADIIECEGLGYAVTCYVSSGRIEDGEMRILWEEVREKLREIERKAFDARRVREGG